MNAKLLEITLAENKVKNRDNVKNRKGNKEIIEKCFERFLKMNAYDLALEEPVRAYNFLLREVMDGFEGSAKEKQEFFNRLLMTVIELLEENEYLKIAENLSNHYKTQLNSKIKNSKIKTTLQRSGDVDILDEESLLNVVEREYLYDFESWLKSRENRALLNFAYAFWVDGSQKEAKSFLKEQICMEKEWEVERKENILKNAIKYLKLLIKREIGDI